MRLCVIAVLSFSLAGCFNFDAAYARYCTLNKCPDAGTGGGSGGGTGGGSGGGSGGGTAGGIGGGGGAGGAGGAGGGVAGGAGGGGGAGGAGGGAGGVGGGGGAGGANDGGPDGGPSNACDAGLCFVRSYDVPKLQMWTISAAGPNAIFAGGWGGTVVRFDGTNFSPSVLPLMNQEVWSVSATGPNNAWAVGQGGLHTNKWDGTSWVPYSNSVAQGTIYGVQALPDGTALAVDSYGEVMRWTGSAWVLAAAIPGQDTLNDIAACDPEDAWLAAYSPGTIFHFNADAGTIIPEYPGASGVSIDGIFCHPTAGLWAVGAGTLVLHRSDAGVWETFPTPGLSSYLHSVWVSASGEPWIVGNNRTLARLNPEDGGVISYNLPPYNLSNITDVSGTGDQLWVSGIYATGGGFDGGVIVQYNIGPP